MRVVTSNLLSFVKLLHPATLLVNAQQMPVNLYVVHLEQPSDLLRDALS
jgi:hypothetical protein